MGTNFSVELGDSTFMPPFYIKDVCSRSLQKLTTIYKTRGVTPYQTTGYISGETGFDVQ
jgi:hypothetical protein